MNLKFRKYFLGERGPQNIAVLPLDSAVNRILAVTLPVYLSPGLGKGRSFFVLFWIITLCHRPPDDEICLLISLKSTVEEKKRRKTKRKKKKSRSAVKLVQLILI